MSELASVKRAADYRVLSRLNDVCEHDELMDVLNRCGAANMTVCPECRVDDFTHVEGCVLGDLCDRDRNELDAEAIILPTRRWK